MKLILASNSPRRKELLIKAGFDFDIISSDFEENVFCDNPTEVAIQFACGKAKDVYSKLDNKHNVVVLGADTVVFLDGKILGKPDSEIHAIEMLKQLSGKVHQVVTGYCVYSLNKIERGFVTTEVEFNVLDDKVISLYIDSGLYKGKAGAYGIQDDFPLVKEYKGSLSNVIGLPIETVAPIIKSFLENNK